MNCQDFSKLVGDFVGEQKSDFVNRDQLFEHAAICAQCRERLETEEFLTAGLAVLATDEQKIQAPTYLRHDLLVAFDNHVGAAPANVVLFPSRSNWTRWALAAAATILLGFLLFGARWALESNRSETTRAVVSDENVNPSVKGSESNPDDPAQSKSAKAETIETDKSVDRSTRMARRTHQARSAEIESTTTEVASAEVKSEFVPLTYLNDATAMESGIVVRVEIAREQLATLGLPFDLERADEIIKADIVLGDDGVARAIRLVQ